MKKIILRLLVILFFLVLLTRLVTYVAVLTEDALQERNPDGTIAGTEAVKEEGCTTAVLLLHGFGSSPTDFWQVYPLFDDKGLTIYAPLLAGHGTSPLDLKETTYQDWIQSADDAYLELEGSGHEVIIIGNSLGSLLALQLSMEHDPKEVILINPPITLKSKLLRVLPIIGLFEDYHPTRLFSENDETPEFAVKYHNYPIQSISELMSIRDETRKNLYRVDDPLIVFQSEKDTLIEPAGVDIIYQAVSSQEKEAYLLPHSTHTRFSEEDLQLITDVVEPLLTCD